ncbi:MAG: hypothetical protein J6A15_03555 [Clostridia bacterium]|nr:hypothetical protein [Clostridia bacterium]
MIKRQEIYDMYWYFAYERQNIFYKKLNGEKPPYTEDEILSTYKFCNCYRVLDRVSQYLLKNVIYKDTSKYSDEDILFRIILFKLFNKEDTWEYLINSLGDVTLKGFSWDKYNKVLLDRKLSGEKLYNDAYISCATKAYGYDLKHQNHLALLEEMFLKDKVQEKIINSSSMEEVFNIFKSYPLIGDFMAYQLATDINYSNAVNFGENTFTIAGPGAKRGIRKCFSNLEKATDRQVIEYMYSVQEDEFKRLNLDFKYIGGRKLQYIDIQNLFCELDKYLRERRPDLKTNRVKIKKKYLPKSGKIEYMLPPKWNVEI